MAIKSAEEIFVHELKDTYDAEHKLLQELKKMEKKAGDERLGDLFREHIQETEGQIERLEEIFEECDEKAKKEPCAGMAGILQEMKKFVSEEKPKGELLDVYACAAAQKAEHYEIASYTTLISMARQMDMEDAAMELEESLREEQEMLRRLQELGQELLNELPAMEESDEGEEEEEYTSKRNRSR